MTGTFRHLTTTLNSDATLTVQIAQSPLSQPNGTQVLIKVEAAPIHPSDIGAVFGASDFSRATYAPGRVISPVPEAMVKVAASVVGAARQVGNECAGTVIATGDAPEAKALLGKRVAAFSWTAYAQYTLADVASCIAVPDGVTGEQAAAAFVNPLTALGFVETMRREGHSALVHTAATSALGQMLVRICREDGVPLVNIVRSPAQVELLRAQGAEIVLDSTAPDYPAQLAEAIERTGATIAFDAIGGGSHHSQILTAMEAAANKATGWSVYGSTVRKRIYIYGALDMGPTVIARTFGMLWDIGGWLLMPFLNEAGPAVAERLRARVAANLTTTFATHYTARISMEEMLTAETIAGFTQRKTGKKYLLLPSG